MQADNLTSFEKQQLLAAGWKEGEPIPTNMAQIIEEAGKTADMRAAEAAAASELQSPLPPPVSPDTPATQLEVQNIQDLPEAKQAEVRQTLDDFMASPAETGPLTPQQQAIQQQVAASVGKAQADEEAMRQAAAQASQPEIAQRMIASAMKPTAATAQLPTPDVDRPATRVAPDPNYTPEQGKEERAAVASPEQTFGAEDSGIGAPLLTNCPHCNFDLSREGTEEPTHQEKMRFTQALLGMKPYTNTYQLMGGNLVLTFRTLTANESDKAFTQAYADRDANEFFSELDFWEKVNRYQMYMQLVSIDRAGQKPLKFPSGLSPETNPHADSYWKFQESDDSELKQVERFMLANVITTTSVGIVVQNALKTFNQSVSKMEANVDNSDFWNATGEPSA
jgi:hypothetical protein